MLKNVVTKLVPQLLGSAIEIAGNDSGIKRPVVHGQGKIVADHRNFVSFCGFLEQRSGATAVWALQIFEYNYGDLSPFRRSQSRVDGLTQSRSEERRVGKECKYR